MIWTVSANTYREVWLATDPFGIYRERRMRGVQVWRGYEWWMA